VYVWPDDGDGFTAAGNVHRQSAQPGPPTPGHCTSRREGAKEGTGDVEARDQGAGVRAVMSPYATPSVSGDECEVGMGEQNQSDGLQPHRNPEVDIFAETCVEQDGHPGEAFKKVVGAGVCQEHDPHNEVYIDEDDGSGASLFETPPHATPEPSTQSISCLDDADDDF
jgi:hypothetical protein